MAEYDDIIKLVRQRKELQFLSRSFITEHVAEQLRLDKKIRSNYDAGKEATKKQLVKFVREKARKIYGVFQISELIGKRKALLEETKLGDEAIQTILSSHVSTNERSPYYQQFFDAVFALTGKPESVLDIACGLNPVAFYEYTKLTTVRYVANELSPKDAAQLDSFFELNNVPGTAIGFNAVSDLDKYPKDSFDMCFLLKALDTLERQKRYITYDILDKIDAQYIVATFPRSNVKGVKNHRGDEIMWFEKMLARAELQFHRILFPSEVCYICFK